MTNYKKICIIRENTYIWEIFLFMNNSVASFLMRHNFVNHVDVLSVAQGLLDDMIKGADDSLYNVKAAGKGTYIFA